MLILTTSRFRSSELGACLDCPLGNDVASRARDWLLCGLRRGVITSALGTDFLLGRPIRCLLASNIRTLITFGVSAWSHSPLSYSSGPLLPLFLPLPRDAREAISSALPLPLLSRSRGTVCGLGVVVAAASMRLLRSRPLRHESIARWVFN